MFREAFSKTFALFLATLVVNCVNAENANSEVRFLVQALGDRIDNLGENLQKDLNENFRKLSSQLEANGRQVSKTLSIFEGEWKDKTSRLNSLEERQEEIEIAIMSLNKLVHQLTNFHYQFKERLLNSIQPETLPEADLSGISRGPKMQDKTTQNPFPPFFEEDHDSLENASFETYSEVIFQQPPAESSTEPAPTDQVQNDASAFYLSGTPESYRTLEAIPSEDQAELSSIELHYVRIDPEVLEESLQNCNKLKSLKLFQVKFDGSLLDISGRIVLPALTDFVLDQVGVLSFRNDTIFSKWAEIDEFLKGVDKMYLKGLIFFDKDAEETWDVEKVTSLGTNIEVRVDGIRIFRLDNETGEMSSMLKYTNDILADLDPSFLLKKVAISAWRIDLDLLPSTLTHLNMNYVLDSSETNFNRKLEELRGLEELNIFIGNQRDMGWSLTAIPELHLKNLTIRYSDLRDFPTTKLLRLDHLYFHLCQFDLPFIEAFPRVFESLHVGITFRRDSSAIHFALLKSILSTPVQWIFMKNFDRRIPKSTDSVAIRMEQFLLRAGVRRGVEHFILKRKNGSWQGRALNKTELALQTLQLMGTHNFVTFDTYQKIFQ